MQAVQSQNRKSRTAPIPTAVAPNPGSQIWVRARALAAKWGGCSVSQVHRLCAKHRIRRCVLGGTGAKGSSARNAMILYCLDDVEALEKRSTV